MNILCTICARKGSKGLKNKNFLKLNGKELFWYSYNQAKKVKSISNIVTRERFWSFKKNINFFRFNFFYKLIRIRWNYNIGKVPVIRHAFKKAENYYKKKFDIIMDLDVSSPLRNIKDIKNCLKMFKKKKSTNLITGTMQSYIEFFFFFFKIFFNSIKRLSQFNFFYISLQMFE